MSKSKYTRYIYLDFDGVIHHEQVFIDPQKGIYMREPGFTLFQWMPILEELLETYPAVGIILSTSWVRRTSFSYAKSRLSAALQERVIGATFHNRETDKWEFLYMTRARQIFDDVSRRGLKEEDWIAIDDDAEGWPLMNIRNLVRTDGAVGVSDLGVQAEIRAWLEKSAKRGETKEI